MVMEISRDAVELSYRHLDEGINALKRGDGARALVSYTRALAELAEGAACDDSKALPIRDGDGGFRRRRSSSARSSSRMVPSEMAALPPEMLAHYASAAASSFLGETAARKSSNRGTNTDQQPRRTTVKKQGKRPQRRMSSTAQKIQLQQLVLDGLRSIRNDSTFVDSSELSWDGGTNSSEALSPTTLFGHQRESNLSGMMTVRDCDLFENSYFSGRTGKMEEHAGYWHCTARPQDPAGFSPSRSRRGSSFLDQTIVDRHSPRRHGWEANPMDDTRVLTRISRSPHTPQNDCATSCSRCGTCGDCTSRRSSPWRKILTVNEQSPSFPKGLKGKEGLDARNAKHARQRSSSAPAVATGCPSCALSLTATSARSGTCEVSLRLNRLGRQAEDGDTGPSSAQKPRHYGSRRPPGSPARPLVSAPDSKGISTDPLTSSGASPNVPTTTPAEKMTPPSLAFLDEAPKDIRELLEQKELQISMLQRQISSLGEEPINEVATLEMARERLRLAVGRLMDGDDSAEAQKDFDKWDRLVRNHPEHIAEEEAKAREWEEAQATQNADALRFMRSIVPPDIFCCSAERLAADGLPPPLAKRVWGKKALWLARASAEMIIKTHVVELTQKYNTGGLDLRELRALYACLPASFENDADGQKSAWKAGIRQRLQDLVSRQKNGQLLAKDAISPAYAGFGDGEKGPYDPDAEVIAHSVTVSSAYDAVEKPQVSAMAVDKINMIHEKLKESETVAPSPSHQRSISLPSTPVVKLRKKASGTTLHSPATLSSLMEEMALKGFRSNLGGSLISQMEEESQQDDGEGSKPIEGKVASKPPRPPLSISIDSPTDKLEPTLGDAGMRSVAAKKPRSPGAAMGALMAQILKRSMTRASAGAEAPEGDTSEAKEDPMPPASPGSRLLEPKQSSRPVASMQSIMEEMMQKRQAMRSAPPPSSSPPSYI
jgi:hypothetical protein